MPPSTPLVNVRVARWRMRFLASSATAMFTPASAYLIRSIRARKPACRATMAGSPLSGRFACGLENVKQPPPPDGARMDDAVQIGQEAFADLAGLPGFGGSVQGHV